MNNQFDELTKSLAQSGTPSRAANRRKQSKQRIPVRAPFPLFAPAKFPFFLGGKQGAGPWGGMSKQQGLLEPADLLQVQIRECLHL